MPDQSAAQRFACGLALLLKEYAEKLQHMHEELRKVKRDAKRAVLPTKRPTWTGSPEWNKWQHRVGPLQSALLNATRDASQLAEQGDVDDLTRVELRLRLAEVEAYVQAINQELHFDE
jgi:soluble cytochrome b562